MQVVVEVVQQVQPVVVVAKQLVGVVAELQVAVVAMPQVVVVAKVTEAPSQGHVVEVWACGMRMHGTKMMVVMVGAPLRPSLCPSPGLLTTNHEFSITLWQQHHFWG